MPGTYPFTHNYTKPVDYVLASTGTYRNFVFDADRVSTSTRILLGYTNGPVLETFGRLDGVSLSLADPDVGPQKDISGTGRGVWQPGPDPWTISNQQALVSALTHTPTTTNAYLMLIRVRLSTDSVAPTSDDIDASCIVKASSGRAGIMLRASNNPTAGGVNWYYIDIAAGRVKFGVGAVGNTLGTTVFTGTTAISANTDYTLRVTAVGTTYTCYLNGVLEGSFTNAAVNDSGNNGAAGIMTDTTTARFSRFSIAKVANPVATSYTVRNYDGDIITTGSITDDHFDIADSALTWRGHGPYGWYRVYLTGPDHGDSQWGTAYGDTTFYRVRTDSMFVANAPNKYTSSNAIADDYARSTIGGMGLVRWDASSSTSGTIAANNAGTIAGAPVYKTRWVDQALSLRPRLNLAAFSSGTIGIDSTITATVAAMKTFIQAWEPRNEPNYGASGEAYITNEFDPFRVAVKAGDATAKVIGPGPVTYNYSNVGEYLAFINTFLVGCMSRGGTAYLDGVSVHSYNCTNGDLALTRRCLVGLKTAITQSGYTGPLYQTEQGFDWEHFTLVQPRHGGQWTALHQFMLELYGIPHENNSYWYDIAHGFNDVPMYWLDGPGPNGPGPGPQALPLRTMAAEIGNRTLTAQFAFDSWSQYLYAGGTWTGGDGTKTVAFIAASPGLRDLTLDVTGASTLTCVDTWGNTYTIPVTSAQATLPVSEMPVWVRCPAGVTVTPTPVGFITNLASTATVTSTGDQNLLTRVNDGVMQNGYYISDPGPTGGEAPYSDRSNTFPQTITLTWASPVTASRIVLHSMMPWQNYGTLTDFDVDTWDGTTWTTRYTQSLPGAQSALPTTNTFLFTGVGKNLVESYWGPRIAWDIAFTAVPIRAVRVVVRGCSNAEFETAYVGTQIYGNPLTEYLEIRDIQVFNAAAGSTPGVPRLRNPAMGGVTG